MAKRLPINARIVEQLAKVTVKNVVDGIVELITNCDDSYKRLEEKGIQTSGEIEIYVKREKGGICEKLAVKDFAEGMTKEELEKAIEFGGETSGFEKGRSVRGLFGRGLKETIIALGEGEIKTVKDGKLCRTKLWFDERIREPQYDDELLSQVVQTSEKNGTEVNIKITNKKIKSPAYETFKKQLSCHYALRDIMSSKNRKIKLIFEDQNKKWEIPIKFAYPAGEKVKEEEINLPRYGDKVKIIIYESPTPLDSPRYNPYGLAGILIKTKGAILDNQLFKFDTEPSAFYFFGEAICEDLEERLRRGETEIIDPNRAGLEWHHKYCRALSSKIEEVLEPLVLEKKRQLERKAGKEVKEPIKKLLKKLCNELNRFAKQELEEIEEMTTYFHQPDPNIRDLIIKPEVANIQRNKPRTFTVYAPNNLIENEGQVIHIKSDTLDIQPLVTTVNLDKHPKYPEKIWYCYFKVVGKEEEAEGTITVNLGSHSAHAKVKVTPPKERKKGEIIGRKGGFISEIIPDESDNPPQRAEYRESKGEIRIYIKFPSVGKFIKSGLEDVETPEGKILLAEVVGEAFCKAVARKRIDIIGYVPGGEIEAFNSEVNRLQKAYLHKIQEIIFDWKFK